MAHGDDPRGLGAVDGGEILLKPLVLGVGLGVGVVGQGAEWTAVGDVSLALGRGIGACALGVTDERPLRAVCEIGLTVKGDEMGKTVVKRVPHVSNTAGLLAGHAEAMLVGSEVSIDR